MFLGHFQHNLDDKGRLMIPARFRELLEGGAFITQGFDKCLMVMTEAYFKQVYERIEAMNLADPTARLLRRLILSNAWYKLIIPRLSSNMLSCGLPETRLLKRTPMRRISMRRW